MKMRVVRTVEDLRKEVAEWRRKDLSIGLVPTMGALHDGHVTLAGRSVETMDRTIATLFVNPKQFGPNEDLKTYPRDENRDSELLDNIGVDLLFAPTPEVMYPAEYATGVKVSGLGDILEGEYRPGFFDGVATVVSKLLNQAGADRAFFGEKDYQQLLVIRRMSRDLDIPVVIEGVPTVRDKDGLALSSRNAYLTDQERHIAPVLFETISSVAKRYVEGVSPGDLEDWGRKKILDAGFQDVDYLTIRDAENLGAVDCHIVGRPTRVLVAAFLGKARLIDNVAAG